VQKRRPETEWIEFQDESLRIVSDELWQGVQKRLRGARAGTNGANLRGRPPRYLLTGLLKCRSCGGSYTVCNSRSYRCSSQSNGRDVFCDQRKYIYRPLIERELLGGIKEQLLDGKIVKEMARQIRKQAMTPKRDYKSEIHEIDQQIQNVVDSLATIGQSDALTGKLRDLEIRKVEMPTFVDPPNMPLIESATEKWKEIVSDLENLRNCANPDEVESAREILREIIGEVEIREETDGVFAYTKLNAISVYKAGAQNTAIELKPKLIQLR